MCLTVDETIANLLIIIAIIAMKLKHALDYSNNALQLYGNYVYKPWLYQRTETQSVFV